MITMVLGGIWHGANWTFLFWGFYHGLMLGLYRMFAGSWDRLPRLVRNVATMLMVIVGWVFFRSETFSMALTLLRSMFVPLARTGPLSTMPWVPSLAVMLVLAAFVAHGLKNTFELEHRWSPLATLGLLGLFAVCMVAIYGARSSPFLYFQF
jgi:alginate O-acetyltransferase complex protein AlgI